MRKILKYISDFIHLVDNVRDLDRDVENLENKVLAPTEISTNRFWGTWISTVGFDEDHSDKPITLEEKIDLLAKHLKVKFERTEKESEVIVKKVK